MRLRFVFAIVAAAFAAGLAGARWAPSAEAQSQPPLTPQGAVANCVGNADDASGLVKVVGSGSVVNRCLLCQCLTEALPSIDFAHGDLP